MDTQVLQFSLLQMLVVGHSETNKELDLPARSSTYKPTTHPCNPVVVARIPVWVLCNALGGSGLILLGIEVFLRQQLAFMIKTPWPSSFDLRNKPTRYCAKSRQVLSGALLPKGWSILLVCVRSCGLRAWRLVRYTK